MFEWNKSHLGVTQQEIRAAQEIRVKLPPCYSKEFDDCVQESQKPQPKSSPYCDQYYAIIKSTPDAEWDAALKLIPYCSGGTPMTAKKSPSILLPLGIIGLAAGALAIVVNATGSRF